MTTRMIGVLALIAMSAITGGRAAITQDPRCNSAFDIVVQAREQARPNLSRTDLDRILGMLKQANTLCDGYGDAWYYRYLFARQLGAKEDAGYALRRAERVGAEGLRRKDDPFAVTAAASAEVKLPAFVREKWALVVGVGKFKNDISPLRYTAKDAQDFRNWLTQHGRFKPGNVTLLLDEQATAHRIQSEIEQLSNKAGPDDLVVIYISSHGSARSDTKTEVNYIVTYDFDLNRLLTTSLPMVKLIDDAAMTIDAQRVVVLLDTCFSGTATLAGVFSGGGPASAPGSGAEGARGLEIVGGGVPRDLLNRVNRRAGRIVIAASQPNERSYESKTLGNGIFTYYLIQALKQNQGLTSIGEVFPSLRDQVAQHARSEKKVSQVPIMAPEQTRADIRLGIQPQSK